MQYTYTIAVIVPDILNPFFTCLVYYIEKELYKSGYKMFLCQSQREAEKEAYYLRLVRQNKVDGIMGITFNDIGSYLSGDIPVVLIDRHLEKEVCCVASDNFRGGEMAVERLIAGGSRKLIFIRSGSTLSSETLKRGQGFESMCREKNVSYELLDVGDDIDFFDEERICCYLQNHIIDGKLEYDGIYTSTDGLALAVWGQLNRLGIHVPNDVQLIGHDGIRQMNKGAYLVSSIKQPIEEMAKVSVENVIKLIQKKQVKEITILPVSFVEGGTTRPI